MDRKPTKFEVLERTTHGSRVPLARVRAETRDGGRVFADTAIRVGPPDAGANDRLQLEPPGIAEELAQMRSEPIDADGRVVDAAWPATHLLICRRTRQFFNSTGHDLDRLRIKGVTNHAHMNPADLDGLGIAEDEVVEISARHASILGVAKASADLKPGIVSMAHAFGARGSEPDDVRAHGASTNRLVDDESGFDPITGQCRQSAIPVRVRRLQPEDAANPGD
jgi:anaerobic selenocysteine-containing dehydrogenase